MGATADNRLQERYTRSATTSPYLDSDQIKTIEDKAEDYAQTEGVPFADALKAVLKP